MQSEFDIIYPKEKLNTSYEIGLVIATYNRPKYLRKTIKSLAKSNLENTVIIIVDDFSDDSDTIKLIEAIPRKFKAIKAFRKKKDGCKVYDNLQFGWDFLLENFNCKYLTNLDPDTLVIPDWLAQLKDTYELGVKEFGGCVLTGFNAYQHKIIEERPHFYLKKVAGGVNFFFSREIYFQVIRKASINLSWDFQVADNALENGIPIICTKPSVIQHIGQSGLFSNANKGVYDYAIDFGTTNLFFKNCSWFYYGMWKKIRRGLTRFSGLFKPQHR